MDDAHGRVAAMLAIVLILAIVVIGQPLASGCARAPVGTAASHTPAEAAAVVSAAAGLARVTGDVAHDGGDLVACVTALAVAGALDTTATVLIDLDDRVLDTIPAVNVDVAGCRVAQSEPPAGAELRSRVGAITEGILSAVAPLSVYVEMDCRTRAYVTAGIRYARGAAGPVIAEIETPDGNLVVPSVVVDLSVCA